MKFFVDLERNFFFKLAINLLFYSYMLMGIIALFFKELYIIPVVVFWIWFIFMPYNFFFEKHSLTKSLKDFINIIDDPIDDIKHKIHGMKIFGHTFYLPSWLMKGSGKDDK